MKFGGSSLADAGCLRAVARIVADALPDAPLVVLSAMDKTTDALLAAACHAATGTLDDALRRVADLRERHVAAARASFGGDVPPALHGSFDELFADVDAQLRDVARLRELTPRSHDAVAATGELLVSRLFAALLDRDGIDVEWFDARIAMRTDHRFGHARPDAGELRRRTQEHLAPRLRAGRAVVTQGYIGRTDAGLTTTLGRGSSDLSAALFGAALGAHEVQIWTDVDGVMTCDPRIVPAARPIDRLGVAEARELAEFGADVLHPETIQPAAEAGVPVTVRHTFRPRGHFTTIAAGGGGDRAVTAIAGRGPVAIFTVTAPDLFGSHGAFGRLCRVFARQAASFQSLTTNETGLSLSVEADAPIEALVADLSAIAAVRVVRDRAVVSVVGQRLRSRPDALARVRAALGDLVPETVSVDDDGTSIRVVVASGQKDEALRRLHRELVENERAP